MAEVRLDQYAHTLERGRSRLIELLWLCASALLVASWLPGSGWRVRVLRMFGARIGRGVVIKPGVRIKFPWRLVIGDHSWIGERAWIDNLAEVRIGSHCCLSQDVYLCTGSHNWSIGNFPLITKPIMVEDGAWLAARCVVAPGVRIGAKSVLALGAVALTEVPPETVVTGNPASPARKRVIQ